MKRPAETLAVLILIAALIFAYQQGVLSNLAIWTGNISADVSAWWASLFPP